MFVITELSENCKVYHQVKEVEIKRYRFKYQNPINDLPMAEVDYIIVYRGGGSELDRFKVYVGGFSEYWVEFDTVRDATEYVLKCIHDSKLRCDAEVKEIRKFNEKRKRGSKKGKEK